MMLNHTCEGYSAAMELLCLLPQEPTWAEARTLVVDLKLHGQRELVKLVSEARRTFDVEISEERFEGRSVCYAIPRSEYSRITKLSNAYLAAMGEDE